jgi:hypothetical protein
VLLVSKVTNAAEINGAKNAVMHAIPSARPELAMTNVLLR